ncbi:MAG: hypothetical protein V3T03_07910 [Candidatus Bipolaricaulota bacterium]
MKRIGWVVRFQVFAGVILPVLAVTCCAIAENLSINLDVAGSLDAQFRGLDITATIVGEIGLVGDIPHGESAVWLSTEGSIDGVGHRSILTLISKGWILMTAAGQTADGESIDIRSLLYAVRQSLIPLKAGDLFEGVHHTVIQIGESVAVYWGEFAGTLVGGLAPAEIEGTIRLSGTGSFHLTGKLAPEADSADYPETIPLDDPDLPAAFLQTIEEFFDPLFAQESQDI